MSGQGREIRSPIRLSVRINKSAGTGPFLRSREPIVAKVDRLAAVKARDNQHSGVVPARCFTPTNTEQCLIRPLYRGVGESGTLAVTDNSERNIGNARVTTRSISAINY